MSFTTVYFLRRRLFYDDNSSVVEALFNPIHVTFKSSAHNPFTTPYTVNFEKLISSFKCGKIRNPYTESFETKFRENYLQANLLTVNPNVESVKSLMSDFVIEDDYNLTLTLPMAVSGKISFTGDVISKVGNINAANVKIDDESFMENEYRILLANMTPTKLVSISNINMNFKSPDLMRTYYFDKCNFLGEIYSSYKFDSLSIKPLKLKEKMTMTLSVSLSMLTIASLSSYNQKTLSDLSKNSMSDMKYYLFKGEKL